MQTYFKPSIKAFLDFSTIGYAQGTTPEPTPTPTPPETNFLSCCDVDACPSLDVQFEAGLVDPPDSYKIRVTCNSGFGANGCADSPTTFELSDCTITPLTEDSFNINCCGAFSPCPFDNMFAQCGGGSWTINILDSDNQATGDPLNITGGLGSADCPACT